MHNLKLIRERIEGIDSPVTVTNYCDAADYLMQNCYKPEEMWRESCWMLTLDSQKRITGQFLVSIGSDRCTVIDISLVARMALLAGASSVIISHNHPNGNPHPGQHDIQETAKLQKALELLDIEVSDHIIIGEDTFWSFNIEREIKLNKAA